MPGLSIEEAGPTVLVGQDQAIVNTVGTEKEAAVSHDPVENDSDHLEDHILDVEDFPD